MIDFHKYFASDCTRKWIQTKTIAMRMKTANLLKKHSENCNEVKVTSDMIPKTLYSWQKYAINMSRQYF